MKTFIMRVALFAGIICLIFSCLELFLRQIKSENSYHTGNDYEYKHDYLVNHLDDIKILALGHSHIADGINMITLNDSGFNTAIPGRNMYYDAEIVKEFVPKMSNLRTVILPLGYNFQYIKRIEEGQRYMMSKYWGYKLPKEDILMNLEILYGAKGKLKRVFSPQKSISGIYFDSLGHQHLPQVLDDRRCMESLPILESKSDDKDFIREIKEIARVCRDNGVRLIALTMPCYYTYTDRTTPEGMAALHALADTMRSVYPAVEYYDFMNDKRFVADDFFNSSHLNEVGALKFTDILKNEILPLSH